jgi:hypothetical protein
VIDHLCRHTWCVNPFHMEIVTVAENTMRGNGPAAKNARKTHCIRGHEFTEENTGFTMGRKRQRYCKTCKREWSHEYFLSGRRALVEQLKVANA